MMPHTYIVEIHDIHPGSQSRVEQLLALLPPSAVPQTALLLVPNWQGCAPLDQCGALLNLLKTLAGTRILHGYTHEIGQTAYNRWAYATPNHAEFKRLDAHQAIVRLRQGYRIYQNSLNSAPKWFCAPRWQQSRGTAAALARIGIENTMLWGGYVIGRTRLAIPAIGFDHGRRRWKAAAGCWLTTLYTRWLLGRTQPFRLALHPQDLDDGATRRRIVDLLAILDGQGWRPVGIDQVLP